MMSAWPAAARYQAAEHTFWSNSANVTQIGVIMLGLQHFLGVTHRTAVRGHTVWGSMTIIES